MKKKVEAPFSVDARTGKGKALVFEADMTKKGDVEFARNLEAVAATEPKSLQEFLMRLAVQEKKR